ncbi:MAG: hypothetical protein ABIS03_12480 [Gemmatimonadaceae bacterium]
MNLRFSTLALMVLVPCLASPQSATDSTKSAKPAPAPAVDLSGTAFINYQYRTDPGPLKSANRFDVERVYLNFRASAGQRTSVRVTTDLYQQTTSGSDAYYRGWTVRAKYAYLQYNYLDTGDWKALARIGLLHTVFIEQDEQFWPRWISTSPTDRAGYFSSSDAGIATQISLPRKYGEIYSTISNGPGYTSRETDRFKDFATRLTVTPWSTAPVSPLQHVALSLWGYKGATASKFVNGGTGQIGPVGDGLDRDRWGIHLGSATPRVTLGAEYASRREEGDAGSNTIASPQSVTDSTGHLFSAYGVIRPLSSDGSAPHPLSIVGRYDRVTVNTDTDARYDVFIGGLIWDLTSKASVSLDYQQNKPVSGSPIGPSRIWFAHFVARF